MYKMFHVYRIFQINMLNEYFELFIIEKWKLRELSGSKAGLENFKSKCHTLIKIKSNFMA